MKQIILLAAVLSTLSGVSLPAAEPKFVAEDRLILQQVAAEPDIVTPTGIAVDGRGRIWVIENHTHQRPSNYKGPNSDRIRVFDDFDPKTGKARAIRTATEGFKNSMSLAFDRDGRLFLATRSALYELVLSSDGDSVVEKKEILTLETKADYPHNGLSGFAFDGIGNLVFGLGENFGDQYVLKPAKGVSLNGGGEGGSVYRMKRDGSELQRIATGFWNPFNQAYDTRGNLWVVDNDPDARGPCRLLHVVDGGDYGYRFRYGRKGLHPFVAWNGELPGTLPMAGGTYEAPSGILCYQGTALPADFLGKLFVTSWGDHLIEVFDPKPKGASFEAASKILLKGDENFRPVGICQAPDGSIVFSDWVDKSYPVHGKGRIWRIKSKAETTAAPAKIDDKTPLAQLRTFFESPDKFSRDLSEHELVRRQTEGLKVFTEIMNDEKAPLTARIAAMHAIFREYPKNRTEVLSAVFTPSDLQLESLRMIGFDKELIKKVQPSLVPLTLRGASPQANREITELMEDPEDQLLAVAKLSNEDPFLRAAAIDLIARKFTMARLQSLLSNPKIQTDALRTTGLLVALQRKMASGEATKVDFLPFLKNPDPTVRKTAIRIIAEQRLEVYYPKLTEALGVSPTNRDLLETFAAAENWIAFKEPVMKKEFDASEGVIRYLDDEKYPKTIRAEFLKLVDPASKQLKTESLLKWIPDTTTLLDDPKAATPDLVALKLLALRSDPASREYFLKHWNSASSGRVFNDLLLMRLAQGPGPEGTAIILKLIERPEFFANGLLALQSTELKEDQLARILTLTRENLNNPTLASVAEPIAEAALRFGSTHGIEEKMRALVSQKLPKRPATVTDKAAWLKLLNESTPADKSSAKADPIAGERIFFHPNGPKCYSCHRINGAGASIGPELSRIGGALNRERLLESILEPSKEIAPAFSTWQIRTVDGKSRLGMILSENFDSTVSVADVNGKIERIRKLDIEEKIPSTKSLMPDGLEKQLTLKEFRDLLAYLESLK